MGHGVVERFIWSWVIGREFFFFSSSFVVYPEPPLQGRIDSRDLRDVVWMRRNPRLKTIPKQLEHGLQLRQKTLQEPGSLPLRIVLATRALDGSVRTSVGMAIRLRGVAVDQQGAIRGRSG
jgi:hypothetical protein